MPIYEYTCGGCDVRFERLIRSADQEVRCPTCDSDTVTKMFSVFGVAGTSIPESPPPAGGG